MSADAKPRSRRRARTSAAPLDVRLWRMIAACAVLGVGHHVDHMLREATGWPLPGHAVGPFTFSLLVYPVLAVLAVLTLRGRAGAGSWAVFTAVGAAFVGSVHFGPLADDTITMVRTGYATSAAGVAAVIWLAAQVTALAATSVYAGRAWMQHRSCRVPGAPPAPVRAV